MKKSFTELKSKSLQELSKEATSLRDEVMKLEMGSGSNPVKDTNAVSKKKRRLATVLTAMNQQMEAEQFKNIK
jgi:ribosomal protein L29